MIIIDSHKKMLAFWDYMRDQFDKHHYLKIQMNAGNTRTQRQNRALHLLFSIIADELNSRGIDLKIYSEQEKSMDFNPIMVKELIWKDYQKAITGEDSTAKLSSQQCQEIFENMARDFAEKFGIELKWPSHD